MIEIIYKVLTIVTLLVAVLGPVGAILAIVFIPTVALPIIKSLVQRFLSCTFCVAIAILIVASVASFWIGRWGEYDRGSDDAIAKIARNDTVLVNRAKKAREKVKDCQARNMTWSQSTGECR